MRRVDHLTKSMDLAAGARFDMPEEDIARLPRERVPGWADELRRIEAEARRLRKRLEALQSGGDVPTCAECGDPFTGRSDAVYCSPACRLKAYRARKKA